MKRGSNCIIRTINLTDPWTCTRPKAIQKFVKLNVKEPCPKFQAVVHSPYVSPQPVAIRVCTWKDVQRVCPRKPCNWEPPVRQKTMGDRIKAILFLTFKGSMMLAVLYTIKSSLLWREGSIYELYFQAMHVTVPSANDQLDSNDVMKLKDRLIRAYNQAVLNTMGLVAALPLKLDKELRNLFHGRTERRKKATSPTLESDVGERGESRET